MNLALQVPFQGRTYNVDLAEMVTDPASGRTRGKIVRSLDPAKAPGTTQAIWFWWNRAKFPEPMARAPGMARDESAAFTLATMSAVALQIVRDNRGQSADRLDPAAAIGFVSQRIVAGHARRPAVVVIGGKAFLRLGCIVNPEKLSDDQKRELSSLVSSWNEVARFWRDAHGKNLERVSFRQLVDSSMGVPIHDESEAPEQPTRTSVLVA